MFNSLKRSETSCSFKIAMYVLDDKDLIDKLVELDATGDHAVMIVADKGNLEKNQLLKDKILGTNIYLGELGVPYEKGNGQSLHHKFMIADCPDLIDKTGPYKNMPYKEVMLGSYNWSNGANYSNYEDCLYLRDAEVVNKLDAHFDNLINRSVPINLGNRLDESFSEVIEESGRYQPLDSDDPDYYLTDDDF